MRYFFDFEFNENVKPIEIISLGIVADDGREFYAVHRNYASFEEYKNSPAPGDQFPIINSCNDWVKANVLPLLFRPDGPDDFTAFIGDDNQIRNEMVSFVGLDPVPEFWGYYVTYDWFLLTRMFRSFDNMPSKWPQIAYDLQQYARHMGMHRLLPPKLQPAHNALVDARWTKLAFERVKESRDMPYAKAGTWP